jgi:osmoprotectant transport system ATP-binding protein
MLMDEPFSAVDPVVRHSLQDELIRLQQELHKTIIFVTHDIDEAIKLGDKVAVLRVGGKLAQYDEPGRLLSNPVDDFVDSFVGRDRGYRGLGFVSAEGLPIGEIDAIPLGANPEEVRRRLSDGWGLVVDADRTPQGWVWENRLPHREVTEQDLIPGGSLYNADLGSLREALDAALSSPAGLGVAVDADGRVIGSVTADDVLAALAQARTLAQAGAPAGD